MTPPLVEREREVAQLAALVDAVPAGEGRAVLIEGPAGIGKSALLAQARSRAAERRVARAHGARVASTSASSRSASCASCSSPSSPAAPSC